VQNSYGLGYRSRQDEFVSACGERGTAFVPFFAIAGAGRESGAGENDPEELTAVAKAHGASTVQIRLAWALQRWPHLLVIPGTGDPDHLVDNIAAGSIRLGPEELHQLDTVHRTAT
jgi:aryl-alcohol dehydrogenase-like predicted oxidoreductase